MKSTIFYSEQLGDYVVDELCKCGHLKSEHGSKTTRFGRKMLREAHNGSCCAGTCKCSKYVFVRYVCVEEAAEIVASKRIAVA